MSADDWFQCPVCKGQSTKLREGYNVEFEDDVLEVPRKQLTEVEK